MHDAEVHDGLDVPGAEDVLQLLASDVDLRVLDVLRLVGEGAPVDADDAALAMKDARELLAEPPADARDERRRRRRRGAVDGAGATRWPTTPETCRHRARFASITRRCAFAP